MSCLTLEHIGTWVLTPTLESRQCVCLRAFLHVVCVWKMNFIQQAIDPFQGWRRERLTERWQSQFFNDSLSKLCASLHLVLALNTEKFVIQEIHTTLRQRARNIKQIKMDLAVIIPTLHINKTIDGKRNLWINCPRGRFEHTRISFLSFSVSPAFFKSVIL